MTRGQWSRRRAGSSESLLNSSSLKGPGGRIPVTPNRSNKEGK